MILIYEDSSSGQNDREQTFRSGSRKTYLADHLLSLRFDRLVIGELKLINRARLIKLWITGAYGLKLFDGKITKKNMDSQRLSALIDHWDQPRIQEVVWQHVGLLEQLKPDAYSRDMTLGELKNQIVADKTHRSAESVEGQTHAVPLTRAQLAEYAKPLKAYTGWTEPYDLALASQLRRLQRTELPAHDQCTLALMLVCTPTILKRYLKETVGNIQVKDINEVKKYEKEVQLTKMLNDNLLYFLAYVITLKGILAKEKNNDITNGAIVEKSAATYLISELDPKLRMVTLEDRPDFSKIIGDLVAFHGITRVALFYPKSCALLIQMVTSYLMTLDLAEMQDPPRELLPVRTAPLGIALGLEITPHLDAYQRHLQELERRLDLFKAIPIQHLRRRRQP